MGNAILAEPDLRALRVRTIEFTFPFGIYYNSVMDTPAIPEDIRRFVLTSIPSVPFLEALLLLRADPGADWDAPALARRLYVADRVAQALLDELEAAGMAAPVAQGARRAWRYHASHAQLARRVDQLADLYARKLVEVTVLIHSSIDRKAQRFADAFRWRKDS